MIRVSNIQAPLSVKESDFKNLIAKQTGIQNILSCKIAKRSVDARKKNNIRFLFSFDVTVQGNEAEVLKKSKYPYLSLETPFFLPSVPKKSFARRPLVCGTGPAGMAAALVLAQAGANPIVLERGKMLQDRQKDVRSFWAGGALNPQDNVQFGEGGAGAFSDGKLNSGIKKDVYVRSFLENFVDCGAPEEILYVAKPHVGTDNLAVVVQRWREKVVALGGEYRFETTLDGLNIKNGRLTGVTVRLADGRKDEILTDNLVLAIGHSARDTFEMLKRTGVLMERKAFAAGVRIEHRQSLINKIQYGREKPPAPLGAADYKLVIHLPDGRTVYSFCMCPGGCVVGAASEENGVVTNGMSFYARDLDNANAAFLVNITPSDFETEDVLAGVAFQRRLEQAAFLAGNKTYGAPVQRVEDFLNNRETKTFGEVSPSYKPAPVPADLRACLPEFMLAALKEGLIQADRKMRGYLCPDAVLTAVESRSSSPVRILRQADGFESVSCRGLYPCGEGAGYAGGIVSAGADGWKCAEKILQKS